MQLYSLTDKKGRAARELFDYERGCWLEDGMAYCGLAHADRVRLWAKDHGLALEIEAREPTAHVALHCPAAGCYWHPQGQDLVYYLNHVRQLKELIASRQTLRGQLKASTRQLDVQSISLLFDELDEYFGDREDINNAGGPNEAMKFRQAIAVARDALGRLGKC
ncbi:MAG TPA: hypothetical protein VIV60_15290 [Polyangiaceae bacterium]